MTQFPERIYLQIPENFQFREVVALALAKDAAGYGAFSEEKTGMPVEEDITSMPALFPYENSEKL